MPATRTSTKKATAKTSAKQAKPAIEAEPEKMSALDAAARVLQEKGVAMTCPELIGVMATKGYWSSPGGKTPAATLASAIIREISTKGDASRFAKTAPGRFAHRDAPVVAIATAPLPAKKGRSKKAAKATNTDTPADVAIPPAA